MTRRTASLTLALAVLVGALAGCTPSPEPTAEPTPTFSSEAEAFAAAEETYRAYVDALNEVDLSDPETFEAVYAWTTGEANASTRKSLTGMSAEGMAVTGESRFDNFSPVTFTADSTTSVVVAEVCIDVTLVDVVDGAGVSQVPDSRLDRQPATVTFAESDTSTGLAVSTSTVTESDICGS